MAEFRYNPLLNEIVSTASLPKTLLSMAGFDVGNKMIGEDLTKLINPSKIERDNIAFIQISESRVGRAIRTEKYLYAVYAPDKDGFKDSRSDLYVDDYLYDIVADPFELNNLIYNDDYEEIRNELSEILKEQMEKAGETRPIINRYE